jgi:Tfp pilus assembly protein PilN
MRISLSILPEGYRDALQKKAVLRRLIVQEAVFLAIMIFLCVFLMIVLVVLRFERRALSEAAEQGKLADERYRKMDEFEKEFREMNSTMTFAQKAFAVQQVKTPMFDALGASLPDGVVIDSIVTLDATVTIHGMSETREMLETFRDNIRKNGCFDKVDIPLSSLVQKSDFPFDLAFTIKEGCLK